MQLDKKMLEKIGNPVSVGGDFQISLFVVSKKTPRLKKLDLDTHLTSKQRAEKLHKYGQENRFVAVIEMGDQVFAHANAKYAEQLQNKDDLTINGKNVSVKALSDEDYDQLSMIAAAFEESIHQETENSEIDAETPAIRQFFSKHRLVSDQMFTDHMIVRNFSDQVVLKFLRQVNESLLEAARQRRADNRIADIQNDELKKEITKIEVQRQEIKSGTIKQTFVPDDIERTNLTRGMDPSA